MRSEKQVPAKPTVEDVRTKGQVWTPKWVADAMAAYLVQALPGTVLDPAMGPGVLLAAIRDLGLGKIQTLGYEIDEKVLTKDHGSSTFSCLDVDDLKLVSFLEEPIEEVADAVIANPPYLRHHSIPVKLKAQCQELSERELGVKIDARAGLHIYFLIKALAHLKVGGRLSFLVPADTFEGVFANNLWTGISAKYSLDAILTFNKSVAAFPGVDTNAAIVFVSRNKPSNELLWMQWNGSPDSTLSIALQEVFQNHEFLQHDDLQIECVQVEEAIKRGLSRDQIIDEVEGIPFGQLATTMRGIATGDNSFFLMTRDQIKSNGLSEDLFVRTVARVRDVQNEYLSSDDLEELDSSGRPTFLLSIEKTTKISNELRQYLAIGEESGLPNRALVKARSLWYLMEKRKPVPLLFCYLGRRNQRFILAECDVRPTTGFLCVYPLDGIDPVKLHAALNHESTIQALARVGKSYGDGALKVEPGGLRKLIVPLEALTSAGLLPGFEQAS
jgi:adenine-specific DNA-methyltransferase